MTYGYNRMINNQRVFVGEFENCDYVVRCYKRRCVVLCIWGT